MAGSSFLTGRDWLNSPKLSLVMILRATGSFTVSVSGVQSGHFTVGVEGKESNVWGPAPLRAQDDVPGLFFLYFFCFMHVSDLVAAYIMVGEFLHVSDLVTAYIMAGKFLHVSDLVAASIMAVGSHRSTDLMEQAGLETWLLVVLLVLHLLRDAHNEV